MACSCKKTIFDRNNERGGQEEMRRSNGWILLYPMPHSIRAYSNGASFDQITLEWASFDQNISRMALQSTKFHSINVLSFIRLIHWSNGCPFDRMGLNFSRMGLERTWIFHHEPKLNIKTLSSSSGTSNLSGLASGTYLHTKSS